MKYTARTHMSGDLSTDHIGQTITLNGWIHYRRDFGGLIFLEIRDRAGLVQAVFDPSENPDVFAIADKARRENVVSITGAIRQRPEGTANPDLKTGEIELVATQLEILNRSQALPFYPNDHVDASEEVRLKHRYIDLRRPEMLDKLQFRHQITKAMREFLEQRQFVEVETPVLTKATPEGARDYLVPSRTQPGSFFALPQSPQLFKQLLMMSGLDRYYQIVRCFRDEDLRADRQPEFTQLDIELSFMHRDQIMDMMEDLMRHVFKQSLNIDLPNPFPRMSYNEAMADFGIDRPDLRNPLRLQEVSDLMSEVEFKVFSGPANDPDGRVAVIRAPKGGTQFSRKEIDDYTKFVSIYGAKGLAYIKVNEWAKGREGLQSPILKFLPDDVIDSIMQRTKAEDGDILFFGADKAKVVNESLAALRNKLGEDLNLLEGEWAPLWVYDFPEFDWDAKENRFYATHHPFTAPKAESVEAFLQEDPAKALSQAYDMVLNGTELGGGSIRIHTPEMQQVIFEKLGIDATEAQEKFGFLLEALKSGCPPHGGIAFGVDRIVMLLSKSSSIREVIAFPKTQTASCPLTQAPSPVARAQLRELGLQIRSTEAKETI